MLTQTMLERRSWDGLRSSQWNTGSWRRLVIPHWDSLLQTLSKSTRPLQNVTNFLLRASVFAFCCLKTGDRKVACLGEIFTNFHECAEENWFCWGRNLNDTPRGPWVGSLSDPTVFTLSPGPGKNSVTNPSLLNGKGKEQGMLNLEAPGGPS